MSLPHRAAAVYVLLARPDGSALFPPGVESLDPGTVLYDYQYPNGPPPYTPPSPPNQLDFYSYQHWCPNYPDELIVKVDSELANGNNVILIGGGATAECSLLYPVNAQTEYNPGPPLYPGGPSYEPVPTPNGTSDTVYTNYGEPSTIANIIPRWHTATAFDYSSSSGTPSPYSYFSHQGIVPEKGAVYYISVYPGYPDPSNHITGIPASDFVGSWDIEVTNLQSEVLNQQTSANEYYPYTQATTVYKQTGKYVIPNLFEVCCWNKGTVIKGKVSIYSVNVITGTLPATGSGWMGMTAEIGTTFTAESEVSWEVTISDSYTPVEITVPKVSGKATFVNDFWVTEVTPPA
jgi:hypothetical protein